MHLRRALAMGFLLLCCMWSGGRSLADEPTQSHHYIQFKGYQEINGEYVFQVYLNFVPPGQQPPLKKTGDPLGFGGYIVGSFHPNIVTKSTDQGQVTEDDSTLELDQPDTGAKLILIYRRAIDWPE
jgi:hypothetical protein